MTPTHMIRSVSYEIQTRIGLIGDKGDTKQPQQNPGLQARDNTNATTTTSQRAKNPRIQFLRLSSTAETARGLPGLTPPYCPAGPTLLRPASDGIDDSPYIPSGRNRSPLRNLALSNYSSNRYDSQKLINVPGLIHDRYNHSTVRSVFNHRAGNAGVNNIRYYTMPHAVSIPHSGFQALILCGPGIGLSTFTSVPSEFPKALINVANRPMVWYVLDWCYRMGVTDITLITPPAARTALRAALDQNPYLTSLPSPSPDLLAPKDLEFTTPTAELLRLPEVQRTITTDFIILPCDLICEVPGDGFLESYLSTLGGLGGIGSVSGPSYDASKSRNFNLSGEGSGRRGGYSIWYNTMNREESVKGEECDFMATTKLGVEQSPPPLDNQGLPNGTLRKLVWTMPMSELWDQAEENKGWKIRQSLLRKHGSVKCMTSYRDSHIYVLPYWVKEFARINEEFESISEDLVGTWAKTDWRRSAYRAKFGANKVFNQRKQTNDRLGERPIEEEIDLLSLSSTHVTRHTPREQPNEKSALRLASRVQADSDDAVISPTNGSEDGTEVEGVSPTFPPVLAYIIPSSPETPLLRRVDTTPLVLSISLLLAKLPSIDESAANNSTYASPFAHVAKVAGTATIAPRVTISRADTLIDSNTMVATQCVIKSSVIGSSVNIGTGTRITNCVIMDGATIGDKCVLTGTVVGKKAKIGNGCNLQTCEVQDGNIVAPRTEGKMEKYLVGGLEDNLEDDDYDYGDDNDDEGGEGDEQDTETNE